jgi:hypothetical protein
MGGRPSEQTVEHSGSHFKWAADHLPERDFPVSADLVRSTATRLITCENSNCRYGLPAGFASITLTKRTKAIRSCNRDRTCLLRLCLYQSRSRATRRETSVPRSLTCANHRPSHPCLWPPLQRPVAARHAY